MKQIIYASVKIQKNNINKNIILTYIYIYKTITKKKLFAFQIPLYICHLNFISNMNK